MTPPTASTELPSRLGPYTLGPVVGMGPAAVVVRARDTRFDADVAIKVLRNPNPDIGEAFLREGQVLRRVTHPALVAVHDMGQAPDGRPYLVMDLARDSLTDRLRTTASRADAATLLAVIGALADGLGALHEVGIIHGDVAPTNLLLMAEAWAAEEFATGAILAEDERIVLGDLGLSGDAPRSPGFQAPEQSSGAGRIDARADVYSATAVLWSLITGRTPPPSEAVPLEVASVPAEWRALLRTGMATDPESRFPDMASWARAARDVLGAEGAQAPTPNHTATAATPPYKGLATLQPEDTGLFFGRAGEVDTLVARLAQYPVLVVTGASGCGKSSLVRAGLLPWLRAASGPGGADHTTCLLTPGERPLRALIDALGGPDVIGLTSLALHAEPAAVLEVSTGPLLIVVDQFEELFTLCTDPEERAAFLDVLTALTIGAEPRARVVLTVRADFYAACATHPWLAAAANTNQLLVEPMSRLALRQAVEGPAQQVGLTLADGLTERLLADTGDHPTALPLLAYALARTWAQGSGDVRTVADYEATGGVAGAVQTAAEELWAALDAPGQTHVRRLMLRMVQPGDATPDTRRVVDWADLTRPQRELLGPFIEVGLLTLDPDGVRFAHDIVLSAWPRLAGWLVESREELRVSRHMEQAAVEWERSGRRPDLLLTGVALAAAIDWRDRQRGDIAYQVAMFLTEAESEALKASDADRLAERRELTRRRRVMVGLSAATVVAVLVAAGTGTALLRSDSDDSPVLAGAVPTDVQSFAAPAVPGEGDPYRAAVAAIAGLTDGTAPASARASLIRARLALAADRLAPFGTPPLTQLTDVAGGPNALALTADGAILAVGLGGDGVRLIDPATGADRGTLRAQGTSVTSLAFLGDRLVTGDDTGGLRVWSATEGSADAVAADAHRGAVQAITVIGDRVLSAGSDGVLRLWSADLSRQQEMQLDGGFVDVAANADGTTVVAIGRNGQILRWTPDAGSTEVIATLDGARSVALSGDILVAGHSEGRLTAWTLQSGGSQLRWERAEPADGTPDVTFAGPDALVAAGDDGHLRFRDPATGDILGGPLPTTGQELRRVVVGPDATVWAVGRDGKVYRSDVLVPDAACRALGPEVSAAESRCQRS